MTDLTAEGRIRLRYLAFRAGEHGLDCHTHRYLGCVCGLAEIQQAVPALLDELAAERQQNHALRAALQSAVAACPRRCNEGTYRYPTWQGWETRPCKVCGPWRKVLEGKL